MDKKSWWERLTDFGGFVWRMNFPLWYTIKPDPAAGGQEVRLHKVFLIVLAVLVVALFINMFLSKFY